MNTKELPVLLLTGYLGSGKTTLVNRILANQQGIKFAVIVNDIGEVNIDETLIQQGGVVGQSESDDNLVALSNGCICCTLKMDLVQQITDLVNEDKFDYIVIEASGICEPAPIAQTICSIPTLAPQMIKKGVPRLDSIVTVVDGLRMIEEFDNGSALQKADIGEDDLESLVIQQIEFCNTILLNKAENMTDEQKGKLKGIIRAIQPKAEIIECNYCDVSFDKLINTHNFDFNKVATSAAWLEAVEEDVDLENEESGEALEYGIETFVYENRRPFDLGSFDEFVSTKWTKNIIRCKGLVYFRDEQETCYVFEQAGKQMNLTNAGQWYATMPADELKQLLENNPKVKAQWDDKYGDRMQKLVFIGQHLDREAITKGLDSCLED
ncbi:GTP-binding protein [Segatella bryantii]|uniref:Cobalamin biosynthesis protein CobW n=1 Tax=Segatella bryantii TaxID=77095 RepID=A0ABX4EIR6_SEGBR|nr:GTP-binding protein [Segatella bryantii]OYP55393.1 cobalamin biosynthesis protein CobW [Segatella bryantii]UKK82618.1 GTP-binding protein [Segatella bryantii]